MVDEGLQILGLKGSGQRPAHVAGGVPHVDADGAGASLLVVGHGLDDERHHCKREQTLMEGRGINEGECFGLLQRPTSAMRVGQMDQFSFPLSLKLQELQVNTRYILSPVKQVDSTLRGEVSSSRRKAAASQKRFFLSAQPTESYIILFTTKNSRHSERLLTSLFTLK